MNIPSRMLNSSKQKSTKQSPNSRQPTIFIEKPDTSIQNVVQEKGVKIVKTKETNILSFNCKNVKTIGPFIHHYSEEIDILLLQEHWLFDHELFLLNELNQKFSGTGKAVNTGDDYIAFEKSHRGYGGVAILWTKSIDHLMNIISDGNSRIRCIEIKTANPLLCVSTYLPTKVENDRYEEYSECIDQLPVYEIIQKFQSSHEIVI